MQVFALLEVAGRRGKGGKGGKGGGGVRAREFV